MARLKFLVFAVVALGLWGYHLTLVSPAVSSHAAQQASTSLLGAPAAVALKIEAQRSALQAAVVKLSASSAVLNPGPKGAKEPPTADRFNAVRAVAGEALAEADRPAAVIGISNEVGALVAQGSSDPAAPPEGFELATITQGAGSATVANVFGAQHLFYAVPLLVSDRNEVRIGGVVFVGLPLLPDPKVLVDGVVTDLQLGGVAVVSGGAIVASSGPQKNLLDKALKLKAGKVQAIAEGPVSTLGPLNLPLFTDAQTLEIGLNQAIEGTPFSVVAVASSRASLENLAGYQKFALAGLIGLLLLTVIVAVVIGHTDDDAETRMVAPPPLPPPPSLSKKDEAALALAEHEAPPEASPDDFQFPSSPSQIASQPPPFPADDNPPQPEAISNPPPEPPPDLFSSPPPPPPDPFAVSQKQDPFSASPRADPFPVSQKLELLQLTPPPPPKPSGPEAGGRVPPASTLQQAKFSVPPPMTRAPTTSSALMDDDDEGGGGRTVAYPAFKPPSTALASGPQSDPFAMAAANQASEPASDYNPDATRVAAVPAELIKAARSGGTTGERPAIRPQITTMPKVQSVAPLSAVSEEDRHFQDVFREFVATREKCGEAADGLTFDKFRSKLLKNKDQLVLKYSCRTVRFQVYVKDGKAALKATPVKD